MEENYLKNVKDLFSNYKKLGESAIAQISENDLFWIYNEDSNSIAIIIKHLSGNMLSRWTNFLSTDGEKVWRERDAEFEAEISSKKEVLEVWEKGWSCLLETLKDLQPSDMQRIIKIRNEEHTVSEALNRQLAHYAAHVGQIIFIAKMRSKGSWQSLSIPKGGSSEFNKRKFSGN